MRNIKNKKFEKRNIKDLLKKLAVVFAIPTVMGASLTGCGSKDIASTDATSVSTDANTENKSTEEKTTVTKTPTTEKVTEATTQASIVVSDSLNINDNDSIENTVDKIYLDDKEFYDQNGISKNDIRNMIFVINDKYTDENGKVLMDEDSMFKAYDSIDMVMYSDGLFQKIDNVATKDYDVDNFELIKQPSLVKYVDMNLSGSTVLVDEIKEYEKLRDYQVDKMNKEGKFDIDVVNQYVIKNEVTDINSNSNPLSAVRGNGQIYVMASTHKYALDMAGKMNDYDSIYLKAPEYEGINTVKINLTTGERDVMGAVERLLLDGIVTEEQFNNIVTFVKQEIESEKSTDSIIKAVGADYDLNVDYSNLLVSYVKAEMSMSVTGWLDVRCAAMNKAEEAIIEKSKTSSKDDVKKLVYTI